ncbi:hypothetical protein [Rhizobium sp. FY34]|uniref:hypothetical protein n=1 Tax=Rhizobium sp. FY34 TaxID=2562309 RepID=UPI0010BFA7AD|nr:hypothetical protein [Rhizobium sp. FY34]
MIYICYGITKSASTFLYQITEEIFLTGGQCICRIRQPGRFKVENYYDTITVPFLERIERKAAGRAVVLKTHGRLDPGVAQWIRQGRVLANASYRDPREMALSMVDNGARARKLGELPFSEIVTIDDAIPSIDLQLSYLKDWIEVSEVERFSYNEVCFSTETTIDRLCKQIGIGVDPSLVLSAFRGQELIGQINLAKPLRYWGMSEQLQQVFLSRYANFYDEMDLGDVYARQIPDMSHRPRRSLTAHHVGHYRRFLRRLLTTKNLGTILPVILPVLTGFIDRIHAAIFSF